MTCVYVMQGRSGRVKVGSSQVPEFRRATVSSEVHEPVELLHWIECGKFGFYAERKAQNILKARRISGDWFDVEPDKAIAAIKVAALDFVGRLDMPRQKTAGTVLSMCFDEGLIQALDDLRRLEEYLPTRTEMIRRIVVRELQAALDGRDN